VARRGGGAVATRRGGEVAVAARRRGEEAMPTGWIWCRLSDETTDPVAPRHAHSAETRVRWILLRRFGEGGMAVVDFSGETAVLWGGREHRRWRRMVARGGSEQQSRWAE
jgi:hypothetical protein